MTSLFEELDHTHTVLGELVLRRRRYIGLNVDVYEVKLGDDFLMSSLFTTSEQALGRLGVEHALQTRRSGRRSGGPDGSDGPDGSGVDVVVGGLGLGYTAAAVLENPAVRSLVVVEYLEPVIEWHRNGLLPVSAALIEDRRCRFVSADFFACAMSETGFDPQHAGRRFDAVLVDIDHSPDAWLHAENQSFYAESGLMSLQRHLHPRGVFGLWSNEAPDHAFRERMAAAFETEWAEPVVFHNPLQAKEVTQTIYIGVREAQ